MIHPIRLMGASLIWAAAFQSCLVSAQETKGTVPAQPVKLTKNDLRIGFPDSIFRNVPKNIVGYTAAPFNKLVFDQTGLTSGVTHDGPWPNVADKLMKGDYEVGVFLGHEFAWAQAKYPDLEPIVKIVPLHRNLQAFLIVRYDCEAKTIADLKNKKLALPNGFVDHSILFFQAQVRKHLGDRPI
jgi:hypothetical protein